MSINVNPVNYFLKIFQDIFSNFKRSVQEINSKYAKPRIKMTPLVKICLISLRIYLLIMISVLLFKFIDLIIFKVNK